MKLKTKKVDGVNHPAHYNRGNIECIEFIEDQGHGEGFCKGNAMKYLARAGAKGDEIEDLEKSIWYIRRHIELLRAKLEKRKPRRPNEMPQERK